jgi:DNA (cytosine-5)-methyltransferase 1
MKCRNQAILSILIVLFALQRIIGLMKLVENLKICSLFSGIGGFELALGSDGHEPVMFCENDEFAKEVLQRRFEGVPIHHDIRTLENLPNCDLVTAGWPCQDFSQAGQLKGMSGSRSSLITEVFRLIRNSKNRPEYVLLENVAFSLHVEDGAAIDFIGSQFTELGYNWCYRILDAQFFGKPQRRRRLYILAQLDGDPCRVLFRDFETVSEASLFTVQQYGFYWTEGNTGLGWSKESIPPIKGGSGLSIPSPPAVWNVEDRSFVVPGIADAERLQGFPAGWTNISRKSNKFRQRQRWTLLGNAVNVPVVKWIAKGFRHSFGSCVVIDDSSSRRPNAGYGGPNEDAVHFRTLAEGSALGFKTLTDFRLLEPLPLSARAATGFLNRVSNSSLRVQSSFIEDLKRYVSSS